MIYLTDTAATKIQTLFEEKNMAADSAIRFAVKGGGCSGFSLDVNLEPPRKYEMARKNDCKFLEKGIRILVDKKSLLFLDQTRVDYVKEKFGHKFSYENPNAKGWCGCGESFSV